MEDTNLKKLIYYHLSIHTIHGIIHVPVNVALNIYQILFIIIDIYTLPIIGLNISKNNKNIRNIIYLLSLFASGIFSTYYHFILISPDHVSKVPLTNLWGYLFHITAYLISIIDTIGVYKTYNVQFLDKYKNN
jgi:hypothetical protein